MQNDNPAYSIVMDDDKLGLKPDTLSDMYLAIDSKARQLAPAEIRHELRISRDSRKKTRFYVRVSGRMAPHLLTAVQGQAESAQGVALKSYFHRLQEQLVSQMVGPIEPVTAFNIRFDGKLI